MRIPLPTDFKTRTGNPDKDPRQKNSCVEVKGDQATVRKRPSAQGGIAVGTGTAQGGIGLTINGTPYFIGFWGDTMQVYTGGGTSWDSGASYVVGDHVSDGFVDYWATANNTNSRPPNNNWSRKYVPSVPTMLTYAVWNAADRSGGIILSNGDLTVTATDNGLSSGSNVRATIGKSTGKWYWEISVTNIGINFQTISLGLANLTFNKYNYLGFDTNSFGIEPSYVGWLCNGANSVTVINNSFACFGSNFANGAVLGFALDMDAGTLNYYVNGISQGITFTGLTGTLYPTAGNKGNGSETILFTANFGATPFAYAVPSGYNSGIYA